MKKNLTFSLPLFQALALLIGALGVATVTTVPALAQMETKPVSSETPEQVVKPEQKKEELIETQTTEVETTETKKSVSSDNKSLVGIATETKQLTTFMEAVAASELQKAIAENGPYTIFAPTNAAFQQLPKQTLEALLKPENKELLKQVLMYHIVSEKLMSQDLKTGTINTLVGGLSLQKKDYGVIVNDATIVKEDLEASNGVIHLVNRVLIPETVRTSLMEKPEQSE